MIRADIFLNEFGSFYEWLFAILVKDLQNDLFKVFGNVFELILEFNTFFNEGEMIFVDLFSELNSFIFVNQMALMIFKVQKGLFSLGRPFVAHLLLAKQNPYHGVELGSIGHGVD